METALVLTTVGAGFDARALAHELVRRRLVACVNILPGVTSVYRWRDGIEEEGEQLLLMKTSAAAIDALRNQLLALHPYETPEFVVVGIDSLDARYREWLLASLG